MQAEVLLLDINVARLREVDRIYQGHMQTVPSNTLRGRARRRRRRPGHRRRARPARKAPTLISDDLVAQMKPGAVLVDIAVDQGGCFESTRPTTHSDPVFKVHETLFYCVANMPGAVPNTSTYALQRDAARTRVSHRGSGLAAETSRSCARPSASTRGGELGLRAGRRGARPATGRWATWSTGSLGLTARRRPGATRRRRRRRPRGRSRPTSTTWPSSAGWRPTA
jgi:hypothetical protein